MNNIALFFTTNTDKETAARFVDAVIAYFNNFDLELGVIDLISPENVTVLYKNTEIVNQVTGTLGDAIFNYNYVMVAGDSSSMRMLEMMIDNINIINDVDDSVIISSLEGHLHDKYVNDALLVENNSESVLAFIDMYLDALNEETNKKVIKEIKKGLSILKGKL